MDGLGDRRDEVSGDEGATGMTEGAEKGMKKRRKCLLLSLAIGFFGISQYIGWKLSREGNISWTLSGTLLLVGVGLLVGVAASLAILALEKRIVCSRNRAQCRAKAFQRALPGPAICFGLSLLSMLLCWLPGYLAYYPGICSYDMPIQVGQIVSGNYGTHHPLAHTLLVGAFMKLGGALGDVNTGIALYTAFQMLCLALTFAVGIAWIRSLQGKTVWTVLVGLWSCLFTIHW